MIVVGVCWGLLTLVTYDTCDHIFMQEIVLHIRKPQSKYRTFAS